MDPGWFLQSAFLSWSPPTGGPERPASIGFSARLPANSLVIAALPEAKGNVYFGSFADPVKNWSVKLLEPSLIELAEMVVSKHLPAFVRLAKE